MHSEIEYLLFMNYLYTFYFIYLDDLYQLSPQTDRNHLLLKVGFISLFSF